MSDNAEEGIARTQAAAARQQGGDARAIHQQQKRGGEHLGQRIVTFLAGIAFLILVGVWATTDSTLLLYGSLGIALGLVVVWGILRIRALERTRQERQRIAADWSDPAGSDPKKANTPEL